MQEFSKAWGYFEELFFEETKRQAGIGPYDIVITIIAVVVLLLALFVFIFMGMSSWTGESNFVLVIRSLMITFLGGFVGWIRPQNNMGSDAESTQKAVDKAIAEFKSSDESGPDGGG